MFYNYYFKFTIISVNFVRDCFRCHSFDPLKRLDDPDVLNLRKHVLFGALEERYELQDLV